MDNNELNNLNNDSNNDILLGDSNVTNNVQNDALSNNALDKQLLDANNLNQQNNESIDTIFDNEVSNYDVQTPVNNQNAVNSNQVPLNDTLQTNTNTVVAPQTSEPVSNQSLSDAPTSNIVESTDTSSVSNNYSSNEKKSKGPVILIIVLLIAILGLGGYIAYDKFIKSDTPKQETTTDDTKTGLTELKDKTLIESLRNELVAINSVNSLYYDKITSSDMNSKNLIGFNVVKYIGDNDLPLTGTGAYKESGYILNATIPKTNIDEYMNNKYNTNISYTYISKDNNDTLEDIGCSAVLSDENNYYYVTMLGGCNSTKIKTKLIKAEEDKNNVYIYDTYVRCSSGEGWSGCVNTQNDILGLDSMVSCLEGEGTSEKCPYNANETKLVDYVMENMSDKLKTFKHTFKKLDGNYFWVSTESVK